MSPKTHSTFTKTVTIIAGFLILFSIISNDNEQPKIVQAKESSMLELLEQAKKSKDNALKIVEEEDKKIKAYDLLNQISSTDPKVER